LPRRVDESDRHLIGSRLPDRAVARRGLFPLLVALRQWGEDFFFERDEAHVLLVDRKAGQPVRRLELRAGRTHRRRRGYIRAFAAGIA
jgi:hypothetical protein